MGSRWMQILRFAWASPYTLLGLACYLVPWKGQRWLVRHRGTIGIVGPGIEKLLLRAPIPGGAAALTLGHSILATSHETFLDTWEHERIHVLQYERWGPLFVPAYLLCGLWQKVHGKDPYMDNPFEIEARRLS
jgi:hypothetical protein